MLLYRKNLKKIFSYTTLIIMILCLISILSTIYSFPDEINIIQGQNQKIPDSMVFTLRLNKDGKSNVEFKENKIISSFLSMKNNVPETAKANLILLGMLPIKEVTLNIIPDIKVVPSGESIGVRIESKGVLIVGLSSITDGNQVEKERDIVDYLNNRLNKDDKIKVIVEREGRKQDFSVKPIKCEADNIYRIGLWVRNNIAGVGTLTFYDPKSRVFGALGHGITDIDSGVLIDINSGRIVKSKIASIQKARKTTPGELVGVFYDSEDAYGIIEKNTNYGIYGKLNKKYDSGSAVPVSVGLNNQIKEGPAKILTTIEGNKVEEFDIEIQKIMNQRSLGSKSMIIKITDKRLIEKTGGIVQGMSGSPIIQDDKLIGSVTHVLVNDPARGFGISIEWMLKEAGIDFEVPFAKASGDQY